MPHRLFCYGTLQLPPIIRTVIGRVPPCVPAALPGYGCYAVRDEAYPAVIPEKKALTEGRLYEGLSALELARLDRYEGSEYCCQRVLLDAGEGDNPSAVWVYVWQERYRGRVSADRWNLARFEKAHLRRYLDRLGAGAG